ncbi:unnamed protein product (macronuclear) [Paramecium tetraurelia]|uniref:Transmembrane protein n=1 Tax=Paramecium tetraurelia TaxID=5888 RepID=A0DKK4_PARTE|nr:uncharacterized protein GSPATT00017901001 [Paramecium tetraurelia]CAK83571.1 unnamed protein product [Paramecium tetraurelia]|eukprot:XP_001450968.1 hypothetical protein (macronuclear) [Paramecium tetraurelia strain d4-2]
MNPLTLGQLKLIQILVQNKQAHQIENLLKIVIVTLNPTLFFSHKKFVSECLNKKYELIYDTSKMLKLKKNCERLVTYQFILMQLNNFLSTYNLIMLNKQCYFNCLNGFFQYNRKNITFKPRNLVQFNYDISQNQNKVQIYQYFSDHMSIQMQIFKSNFEIQDIKMINIGNSQRIYKFFIFF